MNNLFATEDTEFTEKARGATKIFRFSFTLLVLVCLMGTAHASSAFSKSESTALLDYAKACLLAQTGGNSLPTPPEFATRIQQPCFVTFFIDKRVFACFGGFTPRKASLADEIAENIRLALTNDSRSRNISHEQVFAAGVQITFPIGQPVRVASYSVINPASEGMFIESASAGVAFVPGEAKTASWAFREGMRRLGEKNPQHVTVYRFKAEYIKTPSTARRMVIDHKEHQ